MTSSPGQISMKRLAKPITKERSGGSTRAGPAGASYIQLQNVRFEYWIKLVFGGLWNATLRRPEAVSPVSPVSPPTAPEESSRDRSGWGRSIGFFVLAPRPKVWLGRSAVVNISKKGYSLFRHHNESWQMRTPAQLSASFWIPGCLGQNSWLADHLNLNRKSQTRTNPS